MATIISSKTSGVGGLAVTGDSSGILQLASADGTTAVTIDASQNVGIGTSSPAVKLDVLTTTDVGQINFYNNKNNGGSVNHVVIRDDRGFGATTSANVLQITGYSFGGSTGNFLNITNNSIATTPFKVTNTDAVLACSPSGGLGYGTGSGGTVTQATSKSTAVTLNKPTGQITMNNAALAAGATVTFQFNNSLVTSTDTIVFSILGTYSPNYNVWSGYAGVCYINVRNLTASPQSDAVTINFAIIKGATA